MTVITTTTTNEGLQFCSGRHMDRTSTGRLWAAFQDTSSTIELWYSDDNGATWTENTSARLTGIDVDEGHSFFIDIDDHAHIAYHGIYSGTYRRMASISTATSWSSEFALTSPWNQKHFDIVAFRDGTSWIAAVAARNSSSATRVFIISAVDSSPTISQTLTIGNTEYNSIDFHHTGDAKTISGSTPHIYVAGVEGTRVYFMKLTYSGGSWTAGTSRQLDYLGTKGAPFSLAYDGTRVVMAYAESSTIYIAERDAADTTTTLRTPTALLDGNIINVSVSYDGSGNIHLWAVGATSDDVKRIMFDRAAGTWDGSWTTVYTDYVHQNTLSLKRGYSNSKIEALFSSTLSSPYDVNYESISLESGSHVRIAAGTKAKVRDASGTRPVVRLADATRLS
jgi:hypothetical protein